MSFCDSHPITSKTYKKLLLYVIYFVRLFMSYEELEVILSLLCCFTLRCVARCGNVNSSDLRGSTTNSYHIRAYEIFIILYRGTFFSFSTFFFKDSLVFDRGDDFCISVWQFGNLPFFLCFMYRAELPKVYSVCYRLQQFVNTRWLIHNISVFFYVKLRIWMGLPTTMFSFIVS